MKFAFLFAIDNNVLIVEQQSLIVGKMFRIEHAQEGYQPKNEQEGREYPSEIGAMYEQCIQNY